MKNTTPFAVYVYTGRAHWDHLIDELTEAFCTRDGARTYAETIRRYNPGYYVEIVKEA